MEKHNYQPSKLECSAATGTLLRYLELELEVFIRSRKASSRKLKTYTTKMNVGSRIPESGTQVIQ